MKINKIAGSLAFLAATTLSSAASASTTCAGALSGLISDTTYSCTLVGTPIDTLAYDVTIESTAPGKIEDTYLFSVNTLSDSAFTATNHQHRTKTKIYHKLDGFTLSIFDSNNTQLALVSSNMIEDIYIETPAGDYRAVISGYASGSLSGKYSLTIAAETQPVPVPAAAWLLGSGLIGLVAVARRKE